MQVKQTHLLTCMFCFISAHIGKKFIDIADDPVFLTALFDM